MLSALCVNLSGLCVKRKFNAETTEEDAEIAEKDRIGYVNGVIN